MTVKKVVTSEKFIGLSTDTKPTDGATSVRPGATFYEYDTDLMYITYDGTNWVLKVDRTDGRGRKTVSVTKALAAALAYSAGDVLSEHATTGTDWDFSAIAKENGGKGKIVKAHVISETTAITPRLVLYLFSAAPTSAVNDNVANTALLHADLANYVGRIDFPAMSENGTGDSEAIATESTYGNVPLDFECAAAADDLIGILVTMDAFTQTAGDDMTVRVTVEQS